MNIQYGNKIIITNGFLKINKKQMENKLASEFFSINLWPKSKSK